MSLRPPISRVRAATFLEPLAAMVPEPRCELNYRDPFELLIATQLSAQSTDVMVNRVTPTLFARWPDARAFAEADPVEVEAVLRPTGFFRQKTKNAIASSKILTERFDGQVPTRMEDLLTLPGVARKTANVVLGTAFGVQSGVTVDTHVFRVTRRWGWHREKTPEKVEAHLMKLLPRPQWSDFGHRAVLFGRYHCTARKPACAGCGLRTLCPVGLGDAEP
ncbi:MAG: endonuclease III [Pseudomonadota bacterium]|nr:endonuclease III [Pseudomonadota bacterium]